MIYDLIIIGAGPAGLTAAIYAARYKLNLIVLSRDSGGFASMAHKVCNFPSYNEINGHELMQKFVNQVNELKVPIIFDNVKEITKINNIFKVKTEEKTYESRTIIYATGTERIKLNVKNEGKFIGKGVSYCATCDAGFFNEKIVAVVGGSDAALTSSLLLSEFAKKVYLIHKNDFRAEPAWIDLVKNNKKIKDIINDITEINGDKKVEEIKLKTNEKIKVDGVFIEIGSRPKIENLNNLNLNLNDEGYIITDKDQKTNIKGFFAAGDITNNSLKQIVTASSEGAVAAYQCYNNIKREGMKK